MAGLVCHMAPGEAEESREVFRYEESVLEKNLDLREDVREPHGVPGRTEGLSGGREPNRLAEILVTGIVICTVLLSAIAVVMYRQSDLYTYRCCLQTAEQAYANENYEEAMDYYTQTLALQPDSTEAADGYFDAALAFVRGELSEGKVFGEEGEDLIARYRSLIRKRPEESSLYVEMAQAYLMRKEYGEAIGILQKGYEKTQDAELAEKETYVREHIMVCTSQSTRTASPTIVCIYDQNGNVLREDYYDPARQEGDKPYKGNIYSYDEEQKLLKEVFWQQEKSDSGEEASLSSSEKDYFYDSAGRETICLRHNSSLWFCTYTTYDEQGRVYQEVYSGGTGAIPEDIGAWEKGMNSMQVSIHVYEELEDGGYLEVEAETTDFYDDDLETVQGIKNIRVRRYDAAGNCTESRPHWRGYHQEIRLPEERALWVPWEEAVNFSAADWLERLDAVQWEGDVDVASVSYRDGSEYWEYDQYGNEIVYREESFFSITRTTEYDENQKILSVNTKNNVTGRVDSSVYLYDEWGQHIRTDLKTTEHGKAGYNYIYYSYTYDYIGEPLWSPDFSVILNKE